MSDRDEAVRSIKEIIEVKNELKNLSDKLINSLDGFKVLAKPDMTIDEL